MSLLKDIVILEDRTARSTCTSGFLKVRRLTVQNVWADGRTSEPYPCDIVSRPSSDAMAVVLYHVADRRVRVILKEGIRPPIYLRKLERFVVPDPRPYDSIVEIAAGLIEDEDAGPGGLERRARHEAREET
ncbi:MAG: NUDIX hydrolase, partial [Planctomycetota bacterium]